MSGRGGWADRGGRGGRGRGDRGGRGRGDGGQGGGGQSSQGRQLPPGQVPAVIGNIPRGNRGGQQGPGGRGDGGSGRAGHGGIFQGVNRGGQYQQNQGSGGGRGRGHSAYTGSFRGGGGGGGGGGARFDEPATIYRPGSYKHDEIVSAFENAAILDTAKATKGLTLSSLSLDEPYPLRPEYGTRGTERPIRTNYFELKLKDPTAQFYRYECRISTPDKKPQHSGASSNQIDSKSRRKRYIQLLLQQSDFSGFTVATDYSNIIITDTKLPQDSSTYRITYWHQREDPFPAATVGEAAEKTQARVRKERRITVTYQWDFNPKALWDFVQAKSLGSSFTRKDDYVQMLNIVFQRSANNQVAVSNVGQNEMYPFTDHWVNQPLAESADLGGGVTACRGYYSSIRPGPSRMLVNIQVGTRAFYKAQTVNGHINEVSNGYYNSYTEREVESFLRGLRVVYPPPEVKFTKNPLGQKVKTIFGLGKSARQQQFDWNKTQTSVMKYFSQHHGYTLKWPDQWVLNTGNAKNPTWLPAELCYAFGGQPVQRLLSPRQTSNISNFAIRSPNKNAESIEGNGLRVLSVATPDAQRGSIGLYSLEMGTSMLIVPGRFLPSPQLRFVAKSSVRTVGASWNLAGNKFAKVPTLIGEVTLLHVRTPRSQNLNPAELLDYLINQFASYGLTAKKSASCLPEDFKVNAVDPSTEQEVTNFFEGRLQLFVGKGVRWLFVCIPEKNASLYAIIKYLADVKYGIHTVVIQEKNATKMINSKEAPGSKMTAGNLALKFCIKAGGLAWEIDAASLAPIDADTMVVGIDVTHPAPGSQPKAPSIAAIVASYDAKISGYPGQLSCQTGREETVSALANLMAGRLRYFKGKNGNKLPKKIIVYRDGVSEGQFRMVLDTEYPSMLEAFKQVYPQGSSPKVSIIIVGKRHHTRFYPTNNQDADRTMNTKPGLVVDRGITGYGQRMWDFYIQPHAAIKGTAKSMHCIVLKNEVGFTAQQAETMTHALCYGFHRATKAISVATPAYCADKLAERGRMYLHNVMTGYLGGGGGAATANQPTDSAGIQAYYNARVTPHANIKDSMWYI